jgi:tetratricopeptide (TPR) repeat protein
MSGAPDPIASLLARAKRQMAAKQLTTPLGDAALESYREVLKRMPGHKGAVEGIARIKDEYTRWAQADKRRGRWKSAEASLNKALAIDPEDARLRVALRELAAARERAEQQLAREELRAHPIERAPAEASLETQVNVRALAAPNQAGGEIIITERGCAENPQGSFAVSTAVDQAIRYTGCAVRFNRDRLAIEWDNGTMSAHSLTDFIPSQAAFGWHSSPEDGRSEDPMSGSDRRFEEFERRMGIGSPDGTRTGRHHGMRASPQQ